MSFAEIKEQFETLLKNPQFEEIRNEGQDLVRRFYDLLDSRPGKQEEEEETDAARVEEEKNAEIIRELVKVFRSRAEEFRQEREKNEKASYETRKRILSDLTNLISEEENISKAYFRFNELKDEWRNAGQAAYDKMQELQSEYSRLNELFHYNLNIYKELRENDLKKNIDLRKEIIERLRSLVTREDHKEVETLLRTCQKEWDDCGAVPRESWEEIKEEYRAAIQQVYDLLNKHYEERKQGQESALNEKKAIVEKAIAVGTRFPTAKKWEDATRKLKELQEEWKKAGYAGREENDNVWNAFRDACDAFFAAKKTFYAGLKEKAGDINKVKEELIAKAEELAKSSDWRNATDAIKKLQDQWKKAGHTGLRSDNVLWNKFRAACDHFFNRKKEHFAAGEVQMAENLEKKEKFIAGLKDVELSEDPRENFNKLKEIQATFRELGDVPFKEKDRVYKSFREAMDELWSRAKIDKEERDMEMFKEKIESFGSGENAQRLVFKEKDFIRGRINRITDEIGQIENNLGFFGNSKNAEGLLKEYHQKIENLKKEQDNWKVKLKMLNQLKVTS